MSEGGLASRGEHAHAARGASRDRAVGADPYSAEQARRDVEPVLAAIDAGLAAAAPAIDEAQRCERRSDYERAKAAARGGLERAARELRGAEQLVRRHAELQAPVVAARERLGEAEARAQAIVARRDEALARWQREHPAIARGARAVFSDRMPDTAEPAPAGALPHREAIQAAFGRHDVSGVPARVGGVATGEADALGAEAFTRGGEVAFAEAPGLHTAAHEAAHVMQQRLGVVRHAGVGPSDGALEAHADRVADAVVAGEPAEALLDAAPVEQSSPVGAAAGHDDGDAEVDADDLAPAPDGPPVQRKAKAGGLPVAPPDARLTPQPRKLSLRGRIGEASAPQTAALVNQTAQTLAIRGVLHEPAADTQGHLVPATGNNTRCRGSTTSSSTRATVRTSSPCAIQPSSCAARPRHARCVPCASRRSRRTSMRWLARWVCPSGRPL